MCAFGQKTKMYNNFTQDYRHAFSFQHLIYIFYKSNNFHAEQVTEVHIIIEFMKILILNGLNHMLEAAAMTLFKLCSALYYLGKVLKLFALIN